jgi:hypothetical protein
MSDDSSQDDRKHARPASVEDLKSLLIALNAEGVEYVLIGGYALYALGYERGTIGAETQSNWRLTVTPARAALQSARASAARSSR